MLLFFFLSFFDSKLSWNPSHNWNNHWPYSILCWKMKPKRLISLNLKYLTYLFCFQCCNGHCLPCEQICNRNLNCRNHKCPSQCHRGNNEESSTWCLQVVRCWPTFQTHKKALTWRKHVVRKPLSVGTVWSRIFCHSIISNNKYCYCARFF